jgi:acetyl esterase/lipase
VRVRPHRLPRAVGQLQGDGREHVVLMSPLRGTRAGLPPLLIQAGTEELLAPDAGLLAASASAAGVDVTYTRWPRMWHDFTLGSRHDVAAVTIYYPSVEPDQVVDAFPASTRNRRSPPSTAPASFTALRDPSECCA